MRESANYKFNLPDKADQFNLDHWNQNTEKLDEKLKILDDKDLKLNDLINNKFNDLLNGSPSDINSLYYKIMLKAHPVGSLYWSSNPTNPGTLFGGTWSQIKDKFVLACGDTYANGATGGNANTTLTVDNLPSHTHGMNNHTHSFTPTGNISVSINPTFSGVTVTTGGMSANSMGEISMPDTTENHGNYSSSGCISHSQKTVDVTAHWASGNFRNHTFSVNVAHTHSVTAKGSISGGAYSFTGTAGTTGQASGNTTATGSGTAFSNMPPYVAKYCWERVA